MNTTISMDTYRHCWFRSHDNELFAGHVTQCSYEHERLTVFFSEMTRVTKDHVQTRREGDLITNRTCVFDTCTVINQDQFSISFRSSCGEDISLSILPDEYAWVDALFITDLSSS